MNECLFNKLCALVIDAEVCIDNGCYDDLAPSISLDEITNNCERKQIDMDEDLHAILLFIEHYYDAVSHNFDIVIDKVSVLDAREVISKLKHKDKTVVVTHR